MAQLVDLIKWLLAKTRKDLLLAIEGGSSPEALRATYLEEWAFFCSVLAGASIVRRQRPESFFLRPTRGVGNFKESVMLGLGDWGSVWRSC